MPFVWDASAKFEYKATSAEPVIDVLFRFYSKKRLKGGKRFGQQSGDYISILCNGREIVMKRLIKIVILLVVALGIQPAFGQNAPSDGAGDNTQILLDKIKADKKFVVAANMELTESEAKGFWPVYEAYQKDLEEINKRTAAMLKSYADAWNTNSMDNEKAKKLASDFLAILADEVKLMQSYVPKLGQVLPATKVARYLQIVYKIRTIVWSDLSSQIPLVPGKSGQET